MVGAGPVEAGALDDLDLLAEEEVQDELLVVVDLVDLGVDAGKAYRAPLGLTQETPGISLSFSQTRLRCSWRRPPGAVSSWMDWRPPSAAWMAYWAGALGHSRMEASMVRPSR